MILILAAVPLETRLLREKIIERQITDNGSTQLLSGTLLGHSIVMAHSGIGIANMCLTASRVLSSVSPEICFLVGCGGCYPNSGLKNGDLVVADSEFYGDLGVETEDDFVLLDGISGKNQSIKTHDVQNKYKFNKSITSKIMKSLPHATMGPCVTVNCCSGTPALAEKLEKRTGGICENMEGAAAAQICAEAGLQLVELRGISNPVGTRDQSQWDLILGAEAAQRGLLKILETWTKQEIN